jgi:signal transduction histidine kinase/ActR/RegA family two-component response regulator
MLSSLKLLIAGAVAVPLGVAAFAGWVSFDRVREDAERGARHTVQALSEHAHRSFRAHELVIEFVDRYTEGRSWTALQGSPEVHLMLSRLVGAAPDLASVFMLAPDGRTFISSRKTTMPAIEGGDRDYYLALQKADVLFISEPGVGRLSGDRFFTIARRRASANGEFDGLIAVSVNPGYFEKFFDSVVDATDAASLVRADGTMLARHPAGHEQRVTVLPPGSGFMRAISRAPSEGVYVTRSLADGIDRMIAYRRIGDYPVYASFQVSMGKVWSAWRLAMIPFALACLLAMALLLAGVALAESRTRRSAAEARTREAEEASRAKDVFVAALSHELRNPLAAIAAAAEVLQRAGVAEPAARTSAAVISRQIVKLRRMLDDLLDTARAVHGKLGLEKRRVDLRLFADETLAEHLAKTNVRGAVQLRGGEPWVEADPVRLKQMLDNLVENAVKYGARHVDIAIDIEPDWVQAAVRDDGEGIAPELLPRLFSPFVQGAQSLDRARGGLGLGLSLVHRLARLHGGTLAAASAGPGQGSTFTLRLPRAQPPARAVALAAAGLHAPARILIVDDEADARDGLTKLLEFEGHEVRATGDGAAALAELERFQPRFALIDIGLPGIDGYEVARRARSRHPEMRLVAVTGYGQAQDRERAKAAGFDAHLVKPFSYDELARILERLGTGEKREDAA